MPSEASDLVTKWEAAIGLLAVFASISYGVCVLLRRLSGRDISFSLVFAVMLGIAGALFFLINHHFHE